MRTTEPRIAALIPVYNEGIVIGETIKALIDAGMARSDIYIMDDKSTDNTVEVASSYGVNIHSVSENGGKAKAQVEALRYFLLADRYEWIIFLDGDTRVDVSFVDKMRASIENDSSVALYVGHVRSEKNNHIFSASRAFDYTYGQDVAKHGQSNFNVIFVSPGCASVYRTDVLSKLHIDHSTLAEDMDLTMQVHRLRGKVKYVPDAIVNTQDPATFLDYHKQIMRWYRGYWQVVKKHKVFGLTKKQPVDIYMMLITADAIILNRIFWMIAFMLFNPAALPWIIGFDLSLMALISIYAGFRTKRLDVIYRFPVYYWLSYLNFYSYLRAFIEIIVLKRTMLNWNKVARYTF